MKQALISFFQTQLLAWYAQHGRQHLPWKQDRDPYKIWLSEIILQQTRVAQGLPYYEKILEACPSVQDLAQASENEVFALWQGLGYYSRARNLHAAAKEVARLGAFPSSYEGLLALPGVGSYTAAAIASFAFDLPYAVLDGNVFRVLSRFCNESNPIDSTAGKRRFNFLAQTLLAKDQAADYNQAIMDLGATVCLAQNPNCQACPLVEQCQGQNDWEKLPAKSRKLSKKDRFLHYFLIKSNDNQYFIKQRQQGDVWAGLHDFPLLEAESAEVDAQNFPIANPQLLFESKEVLSHQRIFMRVYAGELKAGSELGEAYFKASLSDLGKRYALPKGLLALVKRLKD